MKTRHSTMWSWGAGVALAAGLLMGARTAMGAGEANLTASTYTENFNGIGVAATATLPAGFKFTPAGGGGAAIWTNTANLTATTQAASNGSPTAGGRYNWGATGGTDRAVGFMTSGGYSAPNAILAGFTNNTGNTITQILASCSWEQYRQNVAGLTNMVYFSTDGKTWGTHLSSNLIAGGSSAYGFPRSTVAVDVTSGSQSIAAGEAFYLLFRVNQNSSSGQGIGLDDVSLTLQYAPSEVPPSVTTVAASATTPTAATANGDVTADGGATVTARGVCYKTSAGVAITDNPTAAAAGGAGTFSVDLASLSVNQIYYFRAYAQNSAGTTLAANELDFTTLANTPAAPTVGNPTSSSLDIAVNENSNPASTEFAIQRTSDSQYLQADGSWGASEVWATKAAWGTKTATGLSASTEYFFQVKARNGANVETAFGSTASGTTTAATGIWINPMSAGAPMGTYVLGDTLGDWNVNFEIGTASWDDARVGLGASLAGASYNWGTANWYEDGEGSNKRVRRNLSGYQFTATGNHYVICQARANAVDTYTSKSGNGWGNPATYPPADLASAYFAVDALTAPSAVSAAADGVQTATRVDLGWTRGGDKNALITVATEAPTGSPTQGTAYSASQTFGNQTVVAGSQGGTSLEVTGLLPGQTYYFTFYSENNAYYSTGETAAAVTLGMPQARNTSGGSPQAPATIFLGDTGLTFGFDSWGQIEANYGAARLWLRYNSAYVNYGTASEWTSFVNTDNKTLASGVFDHTGTWYWGMQMDYGSPYGTDFWYKADSADWAALSTSGAGATLTVTVSAINDPSEPTAVANGVDPQHEIDLSWTQNAQANGVLVVRKLASDTWTEPTQGTAYAAGDTLGSGTVVYNGSGTSASASGLVSDSTYDFKYYSVNNGYYSTGVVAQASTASCAPAAPTGLYADPTNSTDFTANWTASAGATNYYVDVSTNEAFSSGGVVNLMGNAGFEAGDFTDWDTTDANYSVVTTAPQEGAYHVTCAATATRNLAQLVSITGDGTTAYEVSFYYKKPSSAGNFRIWCSWTTGGQVSGDSLQPTTYLPVAADWTKVTYTVVPQNGANVLNFNVRAYNGANVDLDNFFVGLSGGGGASTFVPGYENLAVGNVTSVSVTGLTMNATYYYRVRAQGGEACVSGDSAVASVTTAQGVQNQTIDFPAIGAHVVTDAVGLSATASSGLPVTFAVLSGPAAIADLTNLTFTGAGEVSIVASQAGDALWNPAPDVTNTFTVSKAAATVTLDGLAQAYDGTARGVTATTVPAGLTVDLTYAGNAWAPTNPGSYEVVGAINDATYQGSTTGTLVVSVADPASFSATSAGLSSIELAFAANAQSDDVVIVYNQTGIFDVPSGAPPAAGEAFAGGTVFFVGTLSPQTHSGLGSCASVAYKAWSHVDGWYSAGVTDEATTAAPAAPAGLASVPGYTNFAVSWEAVAGASGYRVDVSESETFTGGETVSTVFRETMGTVSSTTLLPVHEAADGFDNDAYTMSSGGISRTGDVRSTSTSVGYADPAGNAASGSANIYMSSTSGDYGFAIAGIDASGRDSLRLSFGYRKENSGANATFNVEWSSDGTTWTAVAVSNMPAAAAATGWYMVSNLYLPSEACVASLSLRWTKTGGTAMRIDDVLLQGVSSSSSYVAGYENLAVAGTGLTVEGLAEGATYYFRVRAEGAGGCASANSTVASATTLEHVRPALSKAAVNVREAGEGRFFVRMNQNPGAVVSVAVSRSAGSTNLYVKSGAALTFNTANWATWKTVTLASDADENADGETATFRIAMEGIEDQFLTATALDDDIGENLALASGGTTASGKTAYQTVQVMDGVHLVQGNYGYAVWTNLASPGSITLDLHATSVVSRVRLLNYDWNYRTHQYRIDSSLNGTDWTLLADASEGEHMGWEDWSAGGQQMRYVRFTGLSNSANRSVCVSEWEVYGTRTQPSPLEFSRTAVNVREAGEGRFFVRLTNAPESELVVNVALHAGDEDLSVKSGATLTFNAANWSAWKAVTLQAAADADADDETATFRVSAPGVAYSYVEATALDDDIGENLALGATTTGKTAYLTPMVVDGTHMSNTNYGYTVWTNLSARGAITMDMRSVVEVSRMRLLNWDFSYRAHQYQIESSTDGNNWTLLVDASTGAHQGWEDWTLADVPLRYLRFTGLSNTANRAVCVSEWEVYGEARQNQTITFPNPGAQERTNTVALTATASSGLPVTLTVAGGPATLGAGDVLAFSGTGMVTVVASQAGDGNWNPASDVTNTFHVLLPKSVVDFGGGDVNVREAGEGRFYVRLSEAPAGDVVVAVTRSAGDAGITVQSGGTMTFNATNWSAWRAVTLAAAADENAVDETATIRIVATGVPEQFRQAVALDDDIGENVALAAGGASITGSISVALTDVIDGIHMDNHNYGYTVWTNEPQDVITLDLGAAMTVSRMRLLNFDWNYRMHQYQIESSLDGETWALLVDASTGAHHGWEDWTLANESIRYLRFTGLSNTYNRAVCVAEWEVYGTRPAGRRAVKASAAVAPAVGVLPTVVLTSDGPADEGGWAAVDGDEETAWVGQVGGGYLVAGYEDALELKSIEVDLAEGSLSGVQYLYSQDGVEWLPLPDLAGNPISLNYLWLVFPDEGTMAVPQVIEIRPNP